ncbi:MAG: hypothetical protein EBT04_06890 [Betaproteobacteria bacterium]|nr:hypothetical protein [Betaproteobacteria bacterium]
MSVTNASIRRQDFYHFKAMERGSNKLRDAIAKALHTPVKPVSKRQRPAVSAVKLPMPDTVRAIVEQIAEDMDVLPEEICGKVRDPEIVAARFVAYVVLTNRGTSLAQVGRWIGGRDHSTVIHGIKVFERDATPWMRKIVARYAGEKAA